MPNQRLKPDAAFDQSKCVSEESDEILMARICEGDQAALGSLFRRYARVVRGVAFKVLRDSSEADDLLQDIFLLIHRLCGTFDRSRGTVRFWILLMTHHRAIMRRRYLTSRHFYTYLDLEEESDQPSHSMPKSTRHVDAVEEALEKKETLRSGFEELSQNQRETLALFFFEGYTFEEIATRLGQTTGNARNHYYRGLDRLRRKIFEDKTQGVLKT
jgi:RNA polymerase sigma-70 factor (ECF subfamily)